MSFTDEEIAYLNSQPLGRIATVAPDGQPDVSAVTYEFDGTHFYIGGIDPARIPAAPTTSAAETLVSQ